MRPATYNKKQTKETPVVVQEQEPPEEFVEPDEEIAPEPNSQIDESFTRIKAVIKTEMSDFDWTEKAELRERIREYLSSL